MIRDRLRAGLRRLTRAFGRIPSAPPTGRTPPTQRAAQPPAPASSNTATDVEPSGADEDEGATLEVEPAAVQQWRDDGVRVVMLDIREPYELASGYARGSWLMPMNSVPQRLGELPRDQRLLIICAAGARSASVTHYLRGQGFPDVWSLAGGVGGLLGRREDTLFAPKAAPLPVLGGCALTPAGALLAPQVPPGAEGQVQAAEQRDGAWIFAARFPVADGGSVYVTDLPADALRAAR